MTENDPLSGLLAALLGGQPAVQQHMQNSGQSLDQVLVSLASAANPPAVGGVTRSPLGDILGGLMGSSAQAGSGPAAGGDPMSALLGGLLGGDMPPGGAPMQGAPAAGSGDAMSALLGVLLDGGTQGGPSSSVLGNNVFLAPIVDAIAAKVGIQPQIAQVVVSFALTQLMGGQRDPQLAQMLGGSSRVSPKYLRDSGLANQLAEQTGLDKKTAAKSLQQVLQAFGTQMGEGTMEDRQQGLRSWLDAK